MKLNRLTLVALVLSLLVCIFVACGAPAETDAPETNAPETNAPETNAPETDASGECLHTDLEVEDVPATCKIRGHHKEICKTCGKTVVETAYPKIDCVTSGEATCTAASVCVNCGKELEPAKGHTFGEKAVNPATCIADGKSVAQCAACGEAVTEVLPKIDHVMGDVLEESIPTVCGEVGYKKGKCTMCDEMVSIDVTLTHSYAKETLSVGADGTIAGTCTICNQTAPMALETVLKLDFENTDLATEIEANEKGSAFAVTAASNTAGVYVTEGGKSFMAPSAKVFVDFDPELFLGSSYYVVSFDISFNQEKARDDGKRPTIFSIVPGFNEDALKAPKNEWGNCVKLDTVTMKLAAVSVDEGKSGGEITEDNHIDVKLGEWHNVTIIVNTTTGEYIVCLDGVYKGVPAKTGAITEKRIEQFGGYFCFRFTDRVENKPYIDNFNMYVVK